MCNWNWIAEILQKGITISLDRVVWLLLERHSNLTGDFNVLFEKKLSSVLIHGERGKCFLEQNSPWFLNVIEHSLLCMWMCYNSKYLQKTFNISLTFKLESFRWQVLVVDSVYPVTWNHYRLLQKYKTLLTVKQR